MYTLTIISSNIVENLADKVKQLAVVFSISLTKDEKTEVLATVNHGFPVDITKEDLLAELTKAKEIFALEHQKSQQPVAPGVEVEAGIAELSGTEL